MEVIGKLIEKRKFVNRGFLIEIYCPIYGHGAILITILLQKYIDDPIALFIMGSSSLLYTRIFNKLFYGKDISCKMVGL